MATRKVAVLVGSLRKDSFNRQLARAVEKLAPDDFGFEHLRIDTAHHFLGLRLNDWTSILVGLGALVAFVVVGRRHPGRETTVLLNPPVPQDDEEATEAAR